jgi:hypothetical protein
MGICPDQWETYYSQSTNPNEVTQQEKHQKIASYQFLKCTKRRWSNPNIMIEKELLKSFTEELSNENHPPLINLCTTNQTNDYILKDDDTTVRNSDLNPISQKTLSTSPQSKQEQ